MKNVEQMSQEADNAPEDANSLARAQALDGLGLTLARLRSKAIDDRKASGIEDDWAEDEEYYEGIDDNTRNENALQSKPPGQAEIRRNANDADSTVFFNITRPYCDAAAARMGDMLLPTDDRNYAIRPTPKPELVSIAGGRFPQQVEKQIDDAYPGDPDKAAQKKAELVAEIDGEINEAKEKARRAQDRIDDWLVECQYHAEVRKVIVDAACAGAGILKGPVPKKTTRTAYLNGKLEQREEISPTSRRINYWNFFPDGSCGGNIHNGSHTFEKDDITEKELTGLIGSPGYFEDEILAALKEGPHEASKIYKSSHDSMSGLRRRKTENLFEIWYYYGRLRRDDIEQLGIEIDDDLNSNIRQLSIDVQITMVNNRVIKAVQNPSDTGRFPYDVMIWQPRKNSPYGIGVARQIRTPQRVVNAAMRNLMDNAGLAGGPMWIVKRGAVEPLDGKYELSPRKGWELGDDATMTDVRNAFAFIEIPMMQDDLQAIIQLALKMAEDVTGMPMLLQGQQGQAPDTVGGMMLMHNNASTVTRRIARLFDDLITEPHIRAYYQYLLTFGDDKEKGDFQIDARGSSALVERDVQNQALMQLGTLVQNPMFGKDPKKWINEMLKAQRLDPLTLDYEDEDWKKIVENLSAPKPDSALEIAQLRVEHEQTLQKMKQDFMQAQTDRQHQLEGTFKALDEENDKRKQVGEREMTIAELKARLTETILKLDTQKELSNIRGQTSARQVLTPPTEPAGRAPNGQAFQR